MPGSSIFISYSHVDEEWKDRLATQLKVLAQEGLVEVWDDRLIQGGDEWVIAIQEAMAKARVAVLLVTAEFLTSKFIRTQEVTTFLRRRKADGLIVFPIIVRPCPWQSVAWLSELQVRPKDGRPLSGGSPYQIDSDLSAIAQEIRSRAEGAAKVVLPEELHIVSPEPLIVPPRSPRIDSPLWRRIAAYVASVALVITVIATAVHMWNFDRSNPPVPDRPAPNPVSTPSSSTEKVVEAIRMRHEKAVGVPKKPGDDANIAYKRLRQAVFLSLGEIPADKETIREAIRKLGASGALIDTFGQNPYAHRVVDDLDEIIEARLAWIQGLSKTPATALISLPTIAIIDEGQPAEIAPPGPGERKSMISNLERLRG